MKKFLIVSLFAIALYAVFIKWGRLNSDKELVQQIRSAVVSGKSPLDFASITKFEWDSLLILTPYVSTKRLEKKLNINLLSIYHFNIEIRDDVSLILFYNQGRLTNMVAYPRYPGDFSNNKNVFVKKKDAKYQITITDNKSTSGADWIMIDLR